MTAPQVISVGGSSSPTVVPLADPTPSAVHVRGVIRPAKLDDITDVDAADVPANTPLVWRRSDDGVYRLDRADTGAVGWGSAVRIGGAAPADTDAPTGAFHLDYSTGAIYQKES